MSRRRIRRIATAAATAAVAAAVAAGQLSPPTTYRTVAAQAPLAADGSTTVVARCEADETPLGVSYDLSDPATTSVLAVFVDGVTVVTDGTPGDAGASLVVTTTCAS